jgi:hypothetical protein
VRLYRATADSVWILAKDASRTTAYPCRSVVPA